MRIKLSAMFWFAVLFTVTVILALAAPPTSQALHTLHISDSTYRVLLLSMLIPYAVIWFAAFYGYDKLQEYARMLHYTAEGRAFKRIADGVRILAWGLVLGAILQLALNIVSATHRNFATAETLILQYFLLAIAIVAFVLIQSGTFNLVEMVKARRSQWGIRMLVIVGALLGALFQRLIAINYYTVSSLHPVEINVIVLTVVVPYAFTWIMGIMSAYELRLYSNRIKGILYRRALNMLAAGLDVVIASSIILQYVSAVFTARASTTPLGNILLIIYVMLAAQAAGFVLIAVGAKRLKKIEEV